MKQSLSWLFGKTTVESDPHAATPEYHHKERTIENILFPRPKDFEKEHYDVIVVGAGLCGARLAAELSRENLKVCVVEEGGLQLHSHIGNSILKASNCRYIDPATLGKSLVDELGTINYNEHKTSYRGKILTAIGGRSTVWGLTCPRIPDIETELFNENVTRDLMEVYLQRARAELLGTRHRGPDDIMHDSESDDGDNDDDDEDDVDGDGGSDDKHHRKSAYKWIKKFQENVENVDFCFTPVAVRNQPTHYTALPPGAYNTADVLIASACENIVRTDSTHDAQTSAHHHHRTQYTPLVLQRCEVMRVDFDSSHHKITGLELWDMQEKKSLKLSSNHVVLCAGAIETPRIIKQSQLPDTHHLVGKGIHDHTILYKYFKIDKKSAERMGPLPIKLTGYPRTKSGSSSSGSGSSSSSSNKSEPSYIVNVSIGTDIFLGKASEYEIDHQTELLGAIVYTFWEPLGEHCRVDFDYPYGERMPKCDYTRFKNTFVNMQRGTRSEMFHEEVMSHTRHVLGLLKAQPLRPRTRVADESLDAMRLDCAEQGAVAHEGGSCRMLSRLGPGALTEHLIYNGINNLSVCDASVFPFISSANPALLLTALTMRHADYLARHVRRGTEVRAEVPDEAQAAQTGAPTTTPLEK